MNYNYSSSFAIEQIKIMLKHCEERLSETEEVLIQFHVYDATTKLSDLESIKNYREMIESNHFARDTIDEMSKHEAESGDKSRLKGFEAAQLYASASSINIEVAIDNTQARVDFNQYQLEVVTSLYNKLEKAVNRLREIHDEIEALMDGE